MPQKYSVNFYGFSNEPRMAAQLAALKESSSSKDEAEELRTLKAWAGSEDAEKNQSEEDLKESSPLTESFMEPEVELQSRDNSSRCSFSILPSDIPPQEENDQNNDAGDVYDSEGKKIPRFFRNFSQKIFLQKNIFKNENKIKKSFFFQIHLRK